MGQVTDIRSHADVSTEKPVAYMRQLCKPSRPPERGLEVVAGRTYASPRSRISR